MQCNVYTRAEFHSPTSSAFNNWAHYELDVTYGVWRLIEANSRWFELHGDEFKTEHTANEMMLLMIKYGSGP